MGRFFRRDTLKFWMWLGVAFFLLFLFVNVTEEMSEGEADFRYFDDWILMSVARYRTPILNGIFMDITALGSGVIIALISLIFAVVFFMLKDFLSITHLLAASVGISVITALVKNYVGRDRPDVVESLVPVFTYSYPSGHSSTAAALYLTFAIMACRHFPNLAHRVALFALGFLIVILVGLSRLYLGVHYPSDVLSGFLIGSAWAFLLAGVISWPYKQGGGK